MRIIHTDNYGGDYPDEKFIEGIPRYLKRETLDKICKLIQDDIGESASRFYKVVEDDYQLRPGFEPYGSWSRYLWHSQNEPSADS